MATYAWPANPWCWPDNRKRSQRKRSAAEAVLFTLDEMTGPPGKGVVHYITQAQHRTRVRLLDQFQDLIDLVNAMEARLKLRRYAFRSRRNPDDSHSRVMRGFDIDLKIRSDIPQRFRWKHQCSQERGECARVRFLRANIFADQHLAGETERLRFAGLWAT